jgi:hypothetical protein
MQDSLQWRRYHELRDGFLSGTLSSRLSPELEELVVENEPFRRDFVDRLHMRAAIAIPNDSVTFFPRETAFLLDDEADIWYRSPRLWIAFLGILAASLLIALGVRTAGFGLARGGLAPTIAKLIDAENCNWGPSSLPTLIGGDLTTGRLLLESGIAKLGFPNVVVTLEGPAEFELIDSAQSKLHAGRAFAEVQPLGKGFRIDTPHASFIAQETVFGINVVEEDETELYVFSGGVEINHRGTTTTIAERSTGQYRFNTESIIDTKRSEPTPDPLLVTAPDVSQYQISTAVGAGWDEYVVSQPGVPLNSSKTLLLAKHPIDDRVGRDYRRKIFLNFDLSSIDRANISEATLQLVSVKSPFGFAALTPDTRFDVFGVLHPHELGWQEGNLSWTESPAADDSWLGVDPQKTKWLGSFVVPTASLDGAYQFASDEMVNFLVSQDEGLAILILVPAQPERSDSYVHAFASKRHPTLSPPTLRLSVRKEPQSDQ